MTEMDAFNGGKDGVRRLETGDPEMKIARIAEDSRGQPGKNRKGRRQNRKDEGRMIGGAKAPNPGLRQRLSGRPPRRLRSWDSWLVERVSGSA